MQQGRLILPHEQEVIAPGLHHLAAEGALAEEGVPGQHPAAPGHPRDEGRGDGQFGLRLVRAAVERLLRQDHALLVAERGEGVDRAPAHLVAQPPALRLAIDRHALAAAPQWVRRGGGREVRPERTGKALPAQGGEDPVQGRLARRAPVAKAERGQDRRALPRRPLRDGQRGVLIGQDRRHRQREERGQGIVDARLATRVGHRGEGGE